MTDPRPWWRRLLCRGGRCPCRHYEDDGGIGGQCVRCGRIVGYVTIAQLRAYADSVRFSDPFAMDLRDHGLGEDDHGTTMTHGYLAAIKVIRELMRGAVGGGMLSPWGARIWLAIVLAMLGALWIGWIPGWH